MKRVFLPAAATAVAAALPGGVEVVRRSDVELAAATGLQPDTVYRGLVALAEAGALVFSRPDRDGARQLRLVASHWVWAAVAVVDGGER